MKYQCMGAILCLLAAFSLERLNATGGETNSICSVLHTPQWTSSGALLRKWGTLSVDQLRVEAEKGDAEAQHCLGYRYLQGDGLVTNQTEAAKWFQKAAEQNFALSQNNLGACFESGWGVSKNLDEAIRSYQRAANQGLPVANQNLARLTYSGQSAVLKQESYQDYLEHAAERGDLQSATELGCSHLDPLPGKAGDPTLAVFWLAYAARNGFVGAFANVGWLYLEGDWVPRDPDEAERWFAKGAERGDARSQLGLAMHELTVHSAAPNIEKARDWMLKAADQNLTAAFYQLGRLSELRDIAHEPGQKPDYAAAAQWYQRAVNVGFKPAARRLEELTSEGVVQSGGDTLARLRTASDLGDRDSKLKLALRYWSGEGKPRSADEEPATLLLSLVNTGSPKAMVRLAEFYRTGTHFPKDPLQTLFWLQRAAAPALYDDDAYARLAELKQAVEEKRVPSASVKGLEISYDVYRKALNSREAAIRVGRGYLDGSSPTNYVMAYAWISLAAAKGDKTVDSERTQLLQKLSETDRKIAEQRATGLEICSKLIWPGEE